MFSRLKNWIDGLIWGDRLQKYGLPGRIVVGILRNAYAVLRDIVSGQLTLRAMSLVYTTLLSIVPLLALSFSALKSLGVDKDLEARLYGVFEPLGDKGVGEAGAIASPPAVVNAVLDALEPWGVEHLDMPLQAEKVWRAMQTA